MSIEYLVENIGEEMAGPFQASVTLLPADDVIATDEWDEGLLPGTSNIHIIQLQFPFSSVVQSKQMCIKADLPANVVVEKHEGNNIDCIDI